MNYSIPSEDTLDNLYKSILRNAGAASATKSNVALASIEEASGGNESGASSVRNLDDVALTQQQVNRALEAAGKFISWDGRISSRGSGSEIFSHLQTKETGNVVSGKLFANWWYFENLFDETCTFLRQEFGEMFVREQQMSKVACTIFKLSIS